MPRSERKALIEKLQEARGKRLVITYVTSTRQGHEIQIGDDAFRLIFDHLESGKDLAGTGVDLFIHSNGGSGTVPWRIVSLIREYTKHYAILVPHHAFSAATLIALGANEIVMHKMGCLGPIDPSVANIFNPPHPTAQGQLAPISVEDVTAYFKLVRDELQITHEDELVQALIALTEKIHPLALGNVQRSHNQSRLMAKKLLNTHMDPAQEHEIKQLIDTLKSNLFYHGHPINRDEAKKELKLNIVNPPEAVEKLMWELYLQYEADLKLREPFNPLHELESKAPPAPPPGPLTTAEVVQQMQQLAAAGIALGGVNEQQFVNLAVALIPALRNSSLTGGGKVKLEPLVGACIESVAHSDLFKTDMRLERSSANTPIGPQEVIRHEILWQRWEREP